MINREPIDYKLINIKDLNFLDELNDAQRKAVLVIDGPALVIAGAGSGKTRVLTYRVAHLLKQGIPPDTILSLTFTNKAAREMKDRIIRIAGADKSRYLWMGTFHSIFARILRFESKVLGYPSDYSIYDTSDSRSLIKTIIKELLLDDKIYKPAEIHGRISSAKNNLITASVYNANPEIQEHDRRIRHEQTGEIFRIYSRRCFKAGAMDFDDLLLNTNLLFHDHPEILARYQERFRYILVDEYQDTNYAQYLIIKQLAKNHKNVFVVGDDAQSIYSFRGARIENILNFKNDYPQYKLFKLEQNYRSTKNIVDAANTLISRNTGQIPKKIYSKKETGNKIKVIQVHTDAEEGFLVANLIFDTLLEKQMAYCDFAILYRTNAQSRIFEEALRKRNIPYKVYGSLSFFQRKEIKDLLAYCRILVNTGDEEALKRIINYPPRGIGKTTLGKIQTASSDADVSMWKIVADPNNFSLDINKGTFEKLKKFTALIRDFSKDIKTMNAYDVVFRIASETGILRNLHNSNSPEELSKYENIQELLNGISEFVSSREKEGESTDLGVYLQDVSLLTNADNENEDDHNKVTIMTVHSAKGLEFKHIFISGMEEELFPSAHSTGSLKELEEERRLFYVALTRGKEQVTITYTHSRFRWGVLNYSKPSRFIKEIDGRYLEWIGESPETFQEELISPVSQKFSPTNIKRSYSNTIANFAPPKGKKWVRAKQSEIVDSASSPFKASDPGMIRIGMEVEHVRFGKGKVIHLEGTSPNIKATVFFHNYGQKQLLLKFAKLKIV